jgi:hypothetical protein
VPGSCVSDPQGAINRTRSTGGEERQELAANFQNVLAAVCEGRITPGEAHFLIELLNVQTRAFELGEIEHRLSAIEDAKSELEECLRKLRIVLEGVTDATEQKGGATRTEVSPGAEAPVKPGSPR